MNILDILNNIYTNRKCDWINSIEETNIKPVVIQKWLVMNDAVRVQTRWLDKYVYTIPPKMYLSLVWSIMPKSAKAPYIKYISKIEEVEEFDFILKKIRKQYKLSDNDFNSNKQYLINAIKKDMVWWFSYYGIEKKVWKKYYLNFKLIKEFRNKKNKKPKGIMSFL